MGEWLDKTDRVIKIVKTAHYEHTLRSSLDTLVKYAKKLDNPGERTENDEIAWNNTVKQIMAYLETQKIIPDELSSIQSALGGIIKGSPATAAPKEAKIAVSKAAETKTTEKAAESREKAFGTALARGLGVLKEHKSAVGWIIGLIILVFVGWFVFGILLSFDQTPLGGLIRSSLEQYIPISEIKTGVGNQLCMLSCYATSITSVGSWTAAGGLDKYCQLNCKITAQAEQLGCTNCYSLSAVLEEPTPIPLGTDTVKLTIDATEGKRYSWGVGGSNVIVPIPPAQSPTVSITSSDFQANIVEKNMCTGGNNNECKLNAPIGPYDVPVKLSADFTAPCKPSAQYNAWFTYGYNVTGLSFIKFSAKDYKGSITTPQPTSSPGPLKFNVEPYTNVYTPDAPEVRMTFSLLNQGDQNSQVRVDKIILDQIAPAGYGNLTLSNCIEVDTTPTVGGSYEINSTPAVVPGEENAVNFHCSFKVPSNLNNLKQSAYYTILATAKYNYTYKIVGDTIYPNPRYRCFIGNDWKRFVCVDANGLPTACSGTDASTFVAYNYDDTQWGKASVPDTAWGCSKLPCDRVYRLDNLIRDGTDPTKRYWLNITSDAAQCSISNKVETKSVAGCLKKMCICSTLGKKTDPFECPDGPKGVSSSNADSTIGKFLKSVLGDITGLFCDYSPDSGYGDPKLADTRAASDPPYKCDITDLLQPSGGGKLVYNTIACQVRDSVSSSNGFAVSTTFR